MSNRQHAVRINSTVSDSLAVISGVPQGRIVGPLLFNIHVYINDLPLIPQKFTTECYLDDTKLYASFHKLSAVDDLNQDLLDVRDWDFNNFLLFHPDN